MPSRETSPRELRPRVEAGVLRTIAGLYRQGVRIVRFYAGYMGYH